MSYETLEAAVQSLVATNAALVNAVATTQQQANEAIDEAAASINVTAANVTAAQSHANNAAASAGTVTGVQAAAAASAATATSKASEAAASAAAAASAVLGQATSKLDLSAIDQSVFAGTTLVDAVIYDTSKDSDGGAWRKRCQHTSWYQETIYGKWLGSASSEAAARAISGATTNDYYYDTTNEKFYALNAGAGRTEVFRGNVREFPARVLITAEMSRVVIWDLTQPGSPMWMVFSYAQAGSQANHSIAPYNISSICAGYGRICIASLGTGGYVKGISVVEFASDSAHAHMDGVSGSSRYYTGSIASRNSTAVGFGGALLKNIVNGVVNDTAMTVLPDAPIDPLTGLPVPTIAVATGSAGAGGLGSVINHDGSVVHYNQGGSHGFSVAFLPNKRIAWGLSTSSGVAVLPLQAANIANVTTDPATKFYGNSSTPSLKADLGKRICPMTKAVAVGAASMFIRLHENPADWTNGMVAYTTADYATGWLPGDIRGAWINRADGVSDALADTELVTNGTFDTDTDWVDQDVGSGSSTISGGVLTMDIVDGSNYGRRTQSLSLIVGKTYVLTINPAVGNARYIYVNASAGLQAASFPPSGGSIAFAATAASMALALSGASTGTGNCVLESVSIREIVADRSVKNVGLRVKGTLSRAPVAAGAGLGAVSGFSAANYLERSYTSDLDFGTGAFAFLVPLKEAANTSDEVVFERAYYTGGAYSGARIRLEVLAAGTLKATFSDGTNAVTLTSSAAIDDSIWRTGLVVGYDGTSFRLVGVGGQDLAPPVARGSVGTLNNVNAVLRVGLGADGTLPLANGALALLRATAMWPSVDQLKHIFETEKKLFEPNAQCTLAGTSNAVAALAYDEDTDLLHVGTSWGRSAFQGLLRVSSEATPVGSLKALSASGGAVAQAGASAVDIYVPAYSLREEVERLDDAARALGSQPVFHEFDAVTGQTAFALPIGFRVVAVYSAGALKRAGSTKDYTLAFDGFRWTVNFAVAPGNGAWVSIMTVRA